MRRVGYDVKQEQWPRCIRSAALACQRTLNHLLCLHMRYSEYARRIADSMKYQYNNTERKMRKQRLSDSPRWYRVTVRTYGQCLGKADAGRMTGSTPSPPTSSALNSAESSVARDGRPLRHLLLNESACLTTLSKLHASLGRSSKGKLFLRRTSSLPRTEQQRREAMHIVPISSPCVPS
jgi:hypothetical protein